MSLAAAGRRAVLSLLEDVYGDWRADPAAWQPRPLPLGEAGDFRLLEGGPRQRRYLWVDAWGVLDFVAVARSAPTEQERGAALAAARRLIDLVHDVLGRPSGFPMAERAGPCLEAATLSPYRGLRIGKVEQKQKSDSGMRFDGMYWHYLDKWAFALARYSQEAGDRGALRCAVQLVLDVHPAFFVAGAGMRWKVNVDLSPISGLEDPEPNSDAATAWVVYHVLAATARALGDPLAAERLRAPIEDLTPVVQQYYRSAAASVSADPLGFGLTAWKLQWLAGPAADQQRRALCRAAPAALDVPRHGGLPFRLYGALLGATLPFMNPQPGGGEQDRTLAGLAAEAAATMTARELRTAAGATAHSAINKVMLAAALAPAAFARLPELEPLL
eukprot:EG_transcript_15805